MKDEYEKALDALIGAAAGSGPVPDHEKVDAAGVHHVFDKDGHEIALMGPEMAKAAERLAMKMGRTRGRPGVYATTEWSHGECKSGKFTTEDTEDTEKGE